MTMIAARDQTRGDARLEWGWAAAVFAVALAVRLLFLFSSPDRIWPHSIYYEGDAPVWVEWAGALDRGVPFEFDLPLRAPAVAYLLHWATAGVIEPPFTDFKVLWCVMSAAACGLAYLCFVRIFTRRVSLI